MYREWVDRFSEEGASAYAAFFTEDGALWPPAAPAVEGREAVERWVAAFFDMLDIEVDTWEREPPEVSGDLAIARYHIVGRYVRREDGARLPFDQKYLDVLRRQDDGSWKIRIHAWSAVHAGRTLWNEAPWAGEAPEAGLPDAGEPGGDEAGAAGERGTSVTEEGARPEPG